MPKTEKARRRFWSLKRYVAEGNEAYGIQYLEGCRRRKEVFQLDPKWMPQKEGGVLD